MAAELKHPRPSPIKSQYEDSPTELFNPLLPMVVSGVFDRNKKISIASAAAASIYPAPKLDCEEV
nr:hypothetical protein Itr_chr14CG31100 [Ipomoea trifida]